ncbi:MAG: ribonuclease P protein component [Candidatus Beckwithbacteria bacterium]|nr:ribonuclease P protein component [Patescibacteria group bacterium]
MIPKINRLPGYKIPKLITSPIFLNSNFFVIKILETKSLEPPQIGFIVSTKISKKAVIRNKIKRLLREAIKPHLKTFKKGQNILIIARYPIVDKTLNQIKENLKLRLRRLRTLRSSSS